MSYGIGFAPDATSQLRDLEPLVQEMVLDALEALAANPPRPGKDSDIIRDFAHSHRGGVRVVFLRFVIDHPRCKVTLTGVVEVE